MVLFFNSSVSAQTDITQGKPIRSFPIVVDSKNLAQIETPTKVFDKYWIFVKAKERERTENCEEKSGKWIIFVPNHLADSAWAVIKSNVEQDLLGFGAKSSTMMSAKKFPHRVFIIYTCDWTDKNDVMRVRNRLREIGFTEEIYYKTDAMTRAGIYGEAERSQAPYRE